MEKRIFVLHKEIVKEEFAEGILLQELGKAEHIDAVHWNIKDGCIVPMHHHVQEQFGYVIKGGFEVKIGDETKILMEGDAYFVPSSIPHEFKAIGETEAIDVFTPIREIGIKHK